MINVNHIFSFIFLLLYKLEYILPKVTYSEFHLTLWDLYMDSLKSPPLLACIGFCNVTPPITEEPSVTMTQDEAVENRLIVEVDDHGS